MDKNSTMLTVVCISERPFMPNQITVGSQYEIDRLSIWIDEDGDTYGTVYDQHMHRIGELKLSHFRCL